jgi:hypothetical protein
MTSFNLYNVLFALMTLATATAFSARFGSALGSGLRTRGLASMKNPSVYFDMEIGGKPEGRIVFG